VESVTINGRAFSIIRIATANRNATARLRDGSIVIGLPSRWPAGERERVGSSLLKRAIRAIEKGRWKLEKGKSRFFHGQRLKALGREYEIVIARGSRFGARAANGRIEVKAAEHPDADTRISELVRREITRELMPQLVGRVESINQRHFQATIPKITVRDNLTRWGSCAPDGAISLNFKLLFMPEDVLDYVIVHELAHTRYRSHGPRFWALVEKALPDHRERRSWLRKNGSAVLAGQETRQPDECEIEEPY
jgi:predicted metal-dependent hydrolase